MGADMATLEVKGPGVKSTWWQQFLAKRFGDAVELTNETDGTKLYGYLWRGRMYICSVVEPDSPHTLH